MDDDYDDDDDGYDHDDPNTCPDCGGDLSYDRETGVIWCDDSECLWVNDHQPTSAAYREDPNG